MITDPTVAEVYAAMDTEEYGYLPSAARACDADPRIRALSVLVSEASEYVPPECGWHRYDAGDKPSAEALWTYSVEPLARLLLGPGRVGPATADPETEAWLRTEETWRRVTCRWRRWLERSERDAAGLDD